jgi:hypothetical protein
MYSEVIEDYPNAFPFPAKLLPGWCDDRSIHVVAAEDKNKHIVIVITAYEATLDKWEPDKKTRKKHLLNVLSASMEKLNQAPQRSRLLEMIRRLSFVMYLLSSVRLVVRKM